MTSAIASEIEFAHQLDGAILRGKVDAVARKVIDWKITGEGEKFDAKKSMDHQLHLYRAVLEAQGKGEEIPTECVYRVISRPSIGLKGMKSPDISKHEPLAVFEERCVEWLAKEGKLRDVTVAVTPATQRAALKWAQNCIDRIKWNRERKNWNENPAACANQYGSQCKYLRLCQALKHGEDPRPLIKTHYQEREKRHPELERGDRDTVTYSSLSDFSQCELLHAWKYEKMLDPVGRETSEALYIGDIAHAGLDAYLTHGLKAAEKAIFERQQAIGFAGQDVYIKTCEQGRKAVAIVRAVDAKWGRAA